MLNNINSVEDVINFALEGKKKNKEKQIKFETNIRLRLLVSLKISLSKFPNDFNCGIKYSIISLESNSKFCLCNKMYFAPCLEYACTSSS